jgi:hypothetical protein
MKHLMFALALILSMASVSLADTITLICNYTKYSDEEGVHRVKKDDFILTFLIAEKEGTAYVIGNQASSEVQMLSTKPGLSFIEITALGNVMTTAVDVTSKSVHSRNTIIGGKLVPTQYYGTCKFK